MSRELLPAGDKNIVFYVPNKTVSDGPRNQLIPGRVIGKLGILWFKASHVVNENYCR